MSIPLDRLYHYIESVAQDVYGDVLIYRFYPYGSKNINDLHLTNNNNVTLQQRVLNPEIICYDQEPLNYSMYQNANFLVSLEFQEFYEKLFQKPFDINLYPKKNLRNSSCSFYDKCILLHSELNSPEVKKYIERGEFIPVYYWSHGLIALDWFRYAKYIKLKKNTSKDFLIYNRAWSGTREYRLKFTDLLIDAGLVDHCKTNFNPIDNNTHYRDYTYSSPTWIPTNTLENFLDPTDATSCYSADFDIADYETTNIEIVLETLFDDQRHYLTEKILRPIACKQPFILASSADSLKYLKNYGFKTYSSIFNETYDDIKNSEDRLRSIIKVMTEISQWSTKEKQEKLLHAQKIAEYNHQHFFSKNFKELIISELKNNLFLGLNEIKSTNTGKVFLELDNAPGFPEFNTNFYMTIEELDYYRNIARSLSQYTK